MKTKILVLLSVLAVTQTAIAQNNNSHCKAFAAGSINQRMCMTGNNHSTPKHNNYNTPQNNMQSPAPKPIAQPQAAPVQQNSSILTVGNYSVQKNYPQGFLMSQNGVLTKMPGGIYSTIASNGAVYGKYLKWGSPSTADLLGYFSLKLVVPQEYLVFSSINPTNNSVQVSIRTDNAWYEANKTRFPKR